ncbi:hypothetical protein JS531_04290 [Bifidobacterium sp. CP2]|uniref:hypothetical protein n=1 Tax=Bifidobacterium sp. CP2 TaxID=2809025 RepID=UPI001BDCB70F|nr:hypothetical protein [Bifidobacterium sp. CP2]MBT1181204.1 hypothetical protein [Bifidobacterium sp. CP2]
MLMTVNPLIRTIDAPAETGSSDGGDASGQTPAKSFSQTEVDAIVEKRIARVKSQYADYDELKAKAVKYDEAEDAGRSALEKAQAQAAKYKAQFDQLTTQRQQEQWKTAASEQYGVPVSLLHGSTQEDIEANAKALKEWHDPKPKGLSVPNPAQQPARPSKTTIAQDFENSFNKIGF